VNKIGTVAFVALFVFGLYVFRELGGKHGGGIADNLSQVPWAGVHLAPIKTVGPVYYRYYRDHRGRTTRLISGTLASNDTIMAFAKANGFDVFRDPEDPGNKVIVEYRDGLGADKDRFFANFKKTDQLITGPHKILGRFAISYQCDKKYPRFTTVLGVNAP
jgi:phosphoglycerol transferase MdoB-like AlkP superfamily enzyme